MGIFITSERQNKIPILFTRPFLLQCYLPFPPKYNCETGVSVLDPTVGGDECQLSSGV